MAPRHVPPLSRGVFLSKARSHAKQDTTPEPTRGGLAVVVVSIPMGKNTRSNSVHMLRSADEDALQMAAEIICSPALLATFPSRTILGDPKIEQLAQELDGTLQELRKIFQRAGVTDDPAELHTDRLEQHRQPIDPLQWASGMRVAFANPRFREFLTSCVKVAHRQFWGSDPNAALQFGGNRLPPGTPIAEACARAHRRLASDPDDPRWPALAMVCVGRMIAVTTRGQFESPEWTDFTLFMMQLERHFLLAEGKHFAHALLRANKTYFDGQLVSLIGGRMIHGLAEVAINATDSRFLR